MSVSISIKENTISLFKNDVLIQEQSFSEFEKDPRPFAKSILDMDATDTEKYYMLTSLGF